MSVPFNPQTNAEPAKLQAAFPALPLGCAKRKGQQAVFVVSAALPEVRREHGRAGHVNTLLSARTSSS